MYSLTKDRFAEKTLTLEGKKNTVSMQSILLSMCVFTVSVVFIIGGGVVGGYISKLTNISYLEVRPSFGATVDVARSVYHENALMGIGPNKFVDAWRLYKDPSINQTVFWATDFASGSGYITTLFVTTGILGVVTWLLFFCLFIFAGFKMLFKSAHADRFWYFIGTSSFVGALYLWGMAFLYAPGAVILLLAALFTGITFTSYGALISTRSFSLSISSNKRAGFMLVGVVMVIIIGASSGLYYVGQQYVSVYSYGVALQKLQKGIDSKNAEQEIANAYATSNNEVYALQLASYQLAKINAYTSIEKLSAEQQQELDDSVRNGINAARIAVAKDSTDSATWSTLGSILSVLAGAKVEGTKDGSHEAFEKARSFDPQNPIYLLLEAQLASRAGDLALARTKTEEAIKLKSNYTEALLFMSQIDIAEGKTENAIATTRAIISIEPDNPARYYQLGVLELVQNKLDEGIVAFTKAIELNANYANARYQLALALAQKGDTKKAVDQLKVVLELNPGNTDLISLISRLESGESIEKIFAPAGAPQVQEPTAVTEVNNTVTTTQKPDTNLVSPVNTVSEEAPANDTNSKPASEAQ